MSEEKIVLSIANVGDNGIHVRVDSKSDKDVMSIAAGITDVIMRCPTLMPIIIQMMDHYMKDEPDFESIKMPDFDKILHDNDTD